MRHLLILLALVTLFYAVPSLAVGCAGTCATTSDCTDADCTWCDLGPEECSDCCQFNHDQVNCPSTSDGCFWHAGSQECRNTDSSHACPVQVDEAPAPGFPTWGWLFVAMTLLALVQGVERLWKKNPKSQGH